MTSFSNRFRRISRPLLVILGGLLVWMAAWTVPGHAQDRPGPAGKVAGEPTNRLFARDNLVAWCIVPFDSKKRGPEERAVMLKRLGFTRFAYDWRAEHVASFDAE